MSDRRCRKYIYTGWSDAIPAFEATAPVMKGTRADPAWPDPAIQPIAPVRSQRGDTLPQWFIAIGYIGPINTPMIATATAWHEPYYELKSNSA